MTQNPELMETETFDAAALRKRDFPILAQEIHGHRLVYLDNAATSQKPKAVIDAIREYYERDNANVHRGVHTLSERATRGYEGARATVQRFLSAPSVKEIIFTRGTTEAVNLVAQTFGRQRVAAGDEVLITGLEHHSNIVPWQMLCQEKDATLTVAPIDERGVVTLEAFRAALTDKTKLVSVSHVSNALGTINPLADFVAAAKERGIPVVVDGAQAAPHLPIDVQALGCDFYAFSGHKVYGPTGIGALWGKAEHLDTMPPYQGGGEMIRSVTFERTEYNTIPHKFEAGTPNICGAIGLAAALDYVTAVGLERIAAHESVLLEEATEILSGIDGIRIVGTADHKASVLSFTLEGVHPHDIGTILDQQGIAVRAGHHCAQPVMDFFGVPATARASFALYNTKEDIEALARGLEQVAKVFR
ncbi:MAG: cysteine desulfurase [Planctomycetota bacterium]